MVQGILSKVKLNIEKEAFEAFIVFADLADQTGILGQYGFFDKFIIKFDLQVLNISVNLSRLSQWVYDGYDKRSVLIDKFLVQTENYLTDLYKQNISEDFKPTLERVNKEFAVLKQSLTSQDKLFWAEKALTWANILQHRAKLV